MLKASIALVGVAFAALAVGWVTGQDLLLYVSIVCSALGGIALLRSTLADRKGGGTPAEDAAAAKSDKKVKKLSRRDAMKQKKLSKRDAKKQKKAQPGIEEEELLEEASSVRAIEGAPVPGAASTLGHAQLVAPSRAHLGEHAGVASTDSPEDSVVDFRSRLAAALDTSSLEDPLLLEDEDEDDGLLASRLRAKDAVTSALAEIDDETIDAERKQDEGDEEEEEEFAFVRASGDFDSSLKPNQEEDPLDWIRIDDLPGIAESFKMTRGSREPATRSPSDSAARRTSAGSSAGRPAAGRSTARRSTVARSAPSRATATKGKDRTKPSSAGKASARKAAPGAKQSGAAQSRASSKPKQAASRTASDGSPTRSRAASTAGAKAASKSAQPGATGAKRGPGRPPKAKP